jgi:hypothetical protein
VSEALRRIVDVLGDGSEEETVAVLKALGAESERRATVRETSRTPLPPPGGSTAVHTEVQWI